MVTSFKSPGFNLFPYNYIGCIKDVSRKNYATYEIKEYDFAIFEFQCKMFIAKHIGLYYIKKE
jgi:hypothetical protein